MEQARKGARIVVEDIENPSDGKSSVSTAGNFVQRSPIAAVQLEQPQYHIEEGVPLKGIGLGIVIGSWLFLLGFFSPTWSIVFMPAGAALALTAVIWFFYTLYVRRSDLVRQFQMLEPAVTELRELHQMLCQYLKDLDQRTSKYFHCVTNTKVTTYFMLRQIEGRLGELLVELDRLRTNVDRGNVISAMEVLSAQFEFYDGFDRNNGKRFEVSLVDLSATVNHLIAELEQGIADLEDEISRYVPDRDREF